MIKTHYIYSLTSFLYTFMLYKCFWVIKQVIRNLIRQKDSEVYFYDFLNYKKYNDLPFSLLEKQLLTFISLNSKNAIMMIKSILKISKKFLNFIYQIELMENSLRSAFIKQMLVKIDYFITLFDLFNDKMIIPSKSVSVRNRYKTFNGANTFHMKRQSPMVNHINDSNLFKRDNNLKVDMFTENFLKLISDIFNFYMKNEIPFLLFSIKGEYQELSKENKEKTKKLNKLFDLMTNEKFGQKFYLYNFKIIKELTQMKHNKNFSESITKKMVKDLFEQIIDETGMFTFDKDFSKYIKREKLYE